MSFWDGLKERTHVPWFDPAQSAEAIEIAQRLADFLGNWIKYHPPRGELKGELMDIQRDCQRLVHWDVTNVDAGLVGTMRDVAEDRCGENLWDLDKTFNVIFEEAIEEYVEKHPPKERKRKKKS